MFLDLLIEVILLLIIVLGPYMGYRRGFFALTVKPLKAILRIGAAVSLCVPFGESIIAPIISPMLKNEMHSPVAAPLTRALSTALAFLIILALSGALISLVSGVLDSCVSLGIVGKINSIIGMLFAAIISLLVAWIFISIFDYLLGTEMLSDSRLAAEFQGGLLYRLLKTISLFN